MIDDNIDAVFVAFKTELEKEQELREKIKDVVRELEQKARDLLAVLQKIHQPAGCKKIKEISDKAKELLSMVQKDYEKLSQLIPTDQYFKFFDSYRYTNQRVTYVIALLHYLETQRMITIEEASAMMGIKCRREDGFHLDLDDYLMSLLNLASELARFSVNCVTCGDYDRPFRICEFLSDLDAGFRLLNLKNDSLRKRFDGLKYDVKKVEEVVYDLTVRRLTTNGAHSDTTADGVVDAPK